MLLTAVFKCLGQSRCCSDQVQAKSPASPAARGRAGQVKAGKAKLTTTAHRLYAASTQKRGEL